MIIVNSKYAISSDVHQWMLCKPRKPTEKKPNLWEPFKYYTSLQQASKALQGLMLRTSDYDSFEELKANLAEITELIETKLKVEL
jgi:hypothetical protein